MQTDTALEVARVKQAADDIEAERKRLADVRQSCTVVLVLMNHS